MLATGVDILHIERMEHALAAHGERFLNRVFTPQEILTCAGNPSRLAARFAAKEAVAKALGTGVWRNGVAWTDIEVLKEESGAPRLVLHGAAAAIAATRGLATWSVSLSHDRSRAIALVVAL